MAINDKLEFYATKGKSESNRDDWKFIGFQICQKLSDSDNIWIRIPTHP